MKDLLCYTCTHLFCVAMVAKYQRVRGQGSTLVILLVCNYALYYVHSYGI